MEGAYKYFSFRNNPSKHPINVNNENSEEKEITSTRFWRFFDEEDFEEEFEIVASGNFGAVYKRTFRNYEYLQSKNLPTTYAGEAVAVKDPTAKVHDFVQEAQDLCHEISCGLILHPNIINYIGGVELNQLQRVGVVMELMGMNLRDAIQIDSRLENIRVQLDVAKQIASGMNFLHSLNPFILHKDLRTPNILINFQLVCKIADFGMAHNVAYRRVKNVSIYTSLIPPECKDNQNNFTKKGDVYFYAWILIEIFLNKNWEMNYNLPFILNLFDSLNSLETINLKLRNLIISCSNQSPNQRPSFSEILFVLNSLLNVRYDLELIAQNNWMDVLKEGIENGSINPFIHDSLGRNLFHQCCIFGNLEMLEYLTQLWGKDHLTGRDFFQTTLSHIAARNGYLNILEFLSFHNALSSESEKRFRTSALNLAIAMKHWDAVYFLIPRVSTKVLDSALLSASQEGKLDLVKTLIDHGASLLASTFDTKASPLDQASYNGHLNVVSYLLEKGAPVNHSRPNGSTALYVASENGHTEVVRLLIKYKGDVNRVRDDAGSTPLFMASQEGHTEIVKLLLENGANVNQSTVDDGNTPLFTASQEGYKEIVELLLKYGANVNQEIGNGGTACTIASYFGRYEIVSLLLRHGADINKKALGLYTALDNAQNKKHFKIVELLENYKASLIAKTATEEEKN